MLLGSKSATGNAGSTNRGRILCLLSSAPDPIIHGSVNRQLWLFDTGRSVGLEFRAVVVMACDDEVLPVQERIEAVADNGRPIDVYNTRAASLHVACPP